MVLIRILLIDFWVDQPASKYFGYYRKSGTNWGSPSGEGNDVALSPGDPELRGGDSFGNLHVHARQLKLSLQERTEQDLGWAPNDCRLLNALIAVGWMESPRGWFEVKQ